MSDSDFTHEFFVTSGVQDFRFHGAGEPPDGYPVAPVPDTYCDTVFAETYEERRRAFIAHVLRNPGVDSVKGFFYELIRIEENRGPIHEGLLFAALDYIDRRYDCADFVLAGMLRLYHQLLDSSLLSDAFREKARDTILRFKYWPDEPGVDSMCYWTENHQVLFSSNEYLAGQLFPDEVFSNSGAAGREKRERGKKRVDKWLEMRFCTGFSEWLSNVYYDEDFPAVLNLLDFADDPETARRARHVIDLMLFDMASNSYKGLFACTHGRTYTKEKLNPTLESTADTAKLLFGLGTFANQDNMSAVCFALSSYRMPEVIYRIGTDTGREEWETRQRVSIRFEDAEKWGFGNMDTESAMGLLLFGGYCDPRTINHMLLMLDEFGWWDNQFFNEFAPFKTALRLGRYIGLTKLSAWLMRRDLTRNSLEEANLYTFRTPDYQLSTAQDFRKGFGGDQHHVWQATLGGQAVCFTTHPGGYGLTAPNAYWHGSGFLPRALQHRNVVVVIYNTPRMPTVLVDEVLEFTHAFFPRERFDRVEECDGWIFGEQGDGFIALYSQNGYQWQEEGEYAGQELIAEGRRNIWLVEMGRRADSGSLDAFIEKISNAPLDFQGLKMAYESPSLGCVRAGWKGGLEIDGKTAPTSGYKRYDNPACEAEFAADAISIRHGGEKLKLGL